MKIDVRDNCPVERAAMVFADKWSFLILREFFLEGPRRFQDLQEILAVSPNTLSVRLRRLEEAGVLKRHFYSQNPPRAEYQLTDAGTALGPIIGAIRDWGTEFAPDLPGAKS